MELRTLCALTALSLTVVTTSCAELERVLKHAEDYGVIETAPDQLTNKEVIQGLREALRKGADFAVSQLNVKDGFYGDAALKILLPKEAQPMYDRLEKVPVLNDLMADAVLSINRAAENAAGEAKPIFLNAINGMTIQDGMSILRGSDTAATHYLREKTYEQLYASFKPKIRQSLEKKYVGNLSAEGTYKKVIDTYNAASLNGMLWSPIENNSLTEHTTRKALQGLFVKVAAEEKAIRDNPAHRVTDILKRVFGYDFGS